MQPYVANTRPRPPYITFETRAEEDRDASMKANRPVFKDVHYIIAQQIGSVNSIEKNADDWIKDQYQKAQSGMIPSDWPEFFDKKYQDWKKGVTEQIDGTPITKWGGITPGRLKNYHAYNIFSVEDVAAMNDEAMQKIGMGALNDKQRAQAYLDTQKGGTGEELAALRSELETKSETINRQNDRIEQLVKRLEALERK